MKKITLIFFFQILITSLILAQNQDSLIFYERIAVKNNPDIQVAALNYENSLQKIDYLSSLPDPTISFGYFISPVETRLGPQLGKISVSQMFPWFGTLNTKEKQAATLSNSLYNKYIDKKNEIIYNVKKSYFKLYFITKKLQLIEKQIILYKKLENEALIKMQTNSGNAVDVLVFQMSEEELNISAENIKQEIIKSKNNFNILLNRDILNSITIADTLIIGNIKIFIKDSILNNNFQIKAKQELITMYNFKYTADRKNTYPKIMFGIDYIFIGSDAGLTSSGRNAIMPMISLTVPIYGKRNKSLNSSNRILIDKSNQQLISTKNNINSQFQTLKYNYEKAYRELDLYQNLIKKAEQSLQIVYTTYSTSNIDYDQVIFIQNSILKYKIAIEKAISDINIYNAEYNYLTGK